jgi:hypothetical protein
MMSTSPYECHFNTNCSYCLLRREIIALKFPLFRSPRALFVCPSCGSVLADGDGPKTKRDRLRLHTGPSVNADVSPVAPARADDKRRAPLFQGSFGRPRKMVSWPPAASGR